MSQEYTPVDWVDETPNTPGTLINKARLDQMQTAHHYADGFEEVDAVPTADPGVDYHKVVFCTADTTFYRWDGTQWVKDVDDDTKALLLAHEADHANPHVVTKAQVGLGNCDNTADLDKPISTATQTALDAKVDDTQVVSSWQGTPDNAHIPTEKLVKTSLGDGSVTKVGTEIVGSIQQPIFLLNGVPWTCNPMVDTVSDQTVMGKKISTFSASTSAADNAPQGVYEKISNVTVNSTTSDRYFFLKGAVDYANKLLAGISVRYNANGDVHYSLGTTDSNGTPTGYEFAKFVRSTNTWTSKMVSDMLDAYTPMVRTTGAQTIAGIKTYTGRQIISYTNLELYNSALKIQSQGYDLDTPPSYTTRTLMEFYVASDLSEVASRDECSLATGGNSRSMIVHSHDSDGNDQTAVFTLTSFRDGTSCMRGPNRAYNASNTTDVVNIALLDAYTPMVRTTGNQTISGLKTFTGRPLTIKTLSSGGYTEVSLKISDNRTDAAHTIGTNTVDMSIGRIGFTDGSDNFGGYIGMNIDTNGVGRLTLISRKSGGTFATSDVITDATLATSTAVVHTSGAEDIAGDKRFLANTAMKKNSVDTLVAPNNNQYWGLVFTDKNNKEFGGLRCAYPTTRNQYLYLSLMDLDTDTQVQTFSFFKTHMTGPDRGYNAANIHDVATITTLDGYTPMVRTSGNQTIAGIKTFTSNPIILGDWPNLQIKTSAVLDGASHEDRGNIVWKDNNGNVIGQLRFNMRANNTTQIQLVVKNSDNTDKYVTLAAGDAI